MLGVLQALILHWKGGENRKKKKKRSYDNSGYSYLVTHPNTNATEQGLHVTLILSWKHFFISNEKRWQRERKKSLTLAGKIKNKKKMSGI